MGGENLPGSNGKWRRASDRRAAGVYKRNTAGAGCGRAVGRVGSEVHHIDLSSLSGAQAQGRKVEVPRGGGAGALRESGGYRADGGENQNKTSNRHVSPFVVGLTKQRFISRPDGVRRSPVSKRAEFFTFLTLPVRRV